MKKVSASRANEAAPRANGAATRVNELVSKATEEALNDLKWPLNSNEAVEKFYQAASVTNEHRTKVRKGEIS